MITILTHNYPKYKSENSGTFIRDLWNLIDVEREFVGHLKFRQVNLVSYLIGTWKELRRKKNLIVAYWIYPAGLLAWLSRRPYILNCIGVDIYALGKSKLFALMARPILDRALELVFIGHRPMRIFKEIYGSRYDNKSHLIYLPVNPEDFENDGKTGNSDSSQYRPAQKD